MSKKTMTRRALFTSVISLILCCAMLMGTTFAWFTDSVTSGYNQITAGNLDVELYHSNKGTTEEKVNNNTKLFSNVKLWEPGAVAYENLQVKNEGNLALCYQLALKFTNATKTPSGKTLADVLKVAVVEGGFKATDDREAAKNLTYSETLSTFARKGELKAGQDSNVYGIVIYWEPGANDNEFNMNNGKNTILSIDLGVELFATQLEHEEDSFDNTYDEDAKLEMPDVVAEANTVDAFVEALKSGKVAKLTKDLTLIDDAEIPAGLTSAIDLNDHTLTLGNGEILVKGGLIVTNGTVAAVEGESELSFAFIVANGGALEIESDATINATESGAGAVLMYGGDLDVNGTINTASKAYGVFTMNASADIDVNGAIIGEGIAINQQGGTTNVAVDGSLGNSVLGASGTMNLVYSGEKPVVEDDDTAVTLNIYKATAYEGITQNPDNASQYYINSKAGLKNLNALLGDVAPGEGRIATIELMDDIDLSGEKWEPISSMWVTFNGNNHVISNLTAGMAADGRRSGFWGYAGAVTINDLTLKNVNVSGSQAGTFVASADGTNINNCYLDGTNTVTFTAGVETWNGIGAISGVLTASNINVTIVDGATVTLNKGDMTTDPGCTYEDDLTGYISANGGKVTNNGTVTVIENVKVIDDATLNQAVANATNGSTVTIPGGEFTLPTLSEKEGVTIVGAEDGSTVVGGDDTTTGFGGNFGKNTTIKNINFTGSSNGVRYSYAQGGTTTFENCTFASDGTYGFHIDQSNAATFIFNNCTFSGFNAFAGDLESVTFNNCTFLSNGNYGHTNIWSKGYFNNCTWGDKTSVSPGSGGGTLYFNDVEESYHHEFIGSADSLVAFAESVNNGGDSWKGQKVLLVDDIDLNNETWTPIGQTGATEFKGIFDGQNHTIKNLKVDSSAQTGKHYSSGLFGWAESGVTIQNVKVDGASVTGHHNVAVIVGYTYSAKITNCHVTNASLTCTHANDDACGDKCGVIAGYAGDESRFTNCSASNSTVMAGRDAGQVIGTGYNVSVSNCSATNVSVGATTGCTDSNAGGNLNNAVIGRVMG